MSRWLFLLSLLACLGTTAPVHAHVTRYALLVGNDTGGAVCQLVATRHPERLGRLVLTDCDAYENFLPPMFRPLQVMGHVPGAIFAIGRSMRLTAVRHAPNAFGWLVKHGPDPELTRGWVEPAAAQAAPEQSFQFERTGYFVADRRDHRAGAPVFNRSVTLRDTWAQKAGTR